MARAMGAPLRAVRRRDNVNDTVPQYLATGSSSRGRRVPTLANAMDVGNPSNLERMRWMFGDDVEAMRAQMTASVHTDDEIRQAMRSIDAQHGYVADPHTAVAYLGACRHLEGAPDRRVLLLATAHPAKFGDIVEAAIGRAVPIPAPLAAAMARTRQVVHIAPSLSALEPVL
jgi:threonine synthase